MKGEKKGETERQRNTETENIDEPVPWPVYGGQRSPYRDQTSPGH